MTNLLCVMRAISNFKALLSSRSRFNSPRLSLSPADATAAPSRPRHKPKPSMDEQELAELKRQNEGHAVRLLKERVQVLKTRATGALPVPLAARLDSLKRPRGDDSPDEPERSSSSDSGREHGETPLQSAPPVLGIGTGSSDFMHGHNSAPPPMVVADSPTAVDFNVYDRAYEEEIARIKETGGRPSVYLTWHLGAKEKMKGEQGEALDLMEGRVDEEMAEGEGAKDKLKSVFQKDRFADFVSQTIKDTKERVHEVKEKVTDTKERVIATEEES